MKTLSKTLSLSLALGLLALPAQAQVCEPSDLQDELQRLRRLSLDLRGRLPDIEELNSVVAQGTLDPTIVDGMLNSEALIEQVRNHHRDLLWTNLQGLQITNAIWILRGAGGRTQTPAFWNPAAGRSIAYRGGQVACLDEPARFDEQTGAILTTPDENNPEIQREGWVEVEPYWAPGTTVRVCAFDAQENLTGTSPRGQPIQCDRALAPDCGCGPNLRWCQAISTQVQTIPAILQSANEQLLRYMDGIVREGRPYTDVIVGKDIELNGPLVHWLRYQVQTGGGRLPAISEQDHPLPQLTFDQVDTWERVQRTGRHAGVLTMAGYLLKFQSNRGRANRFYNAFLCQHFEATSALPPATDACHAEPDLTQRCGCKDCHTALEPAAGYWGRWAEAGLLPMNEQTFPTFNQACATPQGGRNPLCRLFYFTEADMTDPSRESEYVGMLRAYVFASAETQENISAGPEALAQEAISSGTFARCTTERVWSSLMNRAPRADEAKTIDALAESFSAGYDLRSLIRAIVERPEYTRGGQED